MRVARKPGLLTRWSCRVNAATIISDLHALGVRIEAHGDKLELAPASVIPPELVEQVRAHKPAVLAHLRWQVKKPERSVEDETKEIAQMVHEDGFALLWCEAVQDLVAFLRDDVDPATIPAGFLVYTEAELRELFGKPGMTPRRLRMIHRIKTAGAKIVNGRHRNA